MKLLSRVYRATFVGFLTLLATSRVSPAFDSQAHRALSQRAVGMSTIDNPLRTNLRFDFPNGVNQLVEAGKTPTALIQEGALLEDSMGLELRVKNHFHNPTLSWDQAGLWPPGFTGPIGYSSIVWSQLQNQGSLGGRSWHEARDAYFTALTSTSKSERNKWYATTFRLLGHAIHHVQDAAVPSHTRNDSHFAPVEIGPDKDPFHSFAERPEVLALINNPNLLPASSPDPSFLDNQPSADSRYSVPIARLFDTSAGDIGASALGNGSGIGLAEYSNANFFSDNTIFPETFPYPGLSNLQITAPEIDPQTGKKKTYLIFKPGFGDGTNYRLAQASSLRNITGTNVPTDIGLDYNVFTDYAYKLLPRAIGYSAGLIDYFFRGKIDSTLWPAGYLWVPWAQRPSSIRVENVVVKAGNEQGGQGTMQLVLVYHHRYAGTPSDGPKFVTSHPVTVNAGSSQTVVFSFDALPFPATFPPETGSHGYVYDGLLVYKGHLGQESAAVVADSQCINPSDGSRYNRFYIFEHASFLDGTPIESAYISEC
jgi:hypothetical protein